MNKGFTLIELLVSIAIVSILSGIILFSITQYINRGKDSNIAGNLAALVPAGEVYYNGAGENSYTGFCETSTVISNAISQMPANPLSNCYHKSDNRPGLCCHVDTENNGNKWAACARGFTNPDNAFCVDSRGVKKPIENSDCTKDITQCD